MRLPILKVAPAFKAVALSACWINRGIKTAMARKNVSYNPQFERNDLSCINGLATPIRSHTPAFSSVFAFCAVRIPLVQSTRTPYLETLSLIVEHIVIEPQKMGKAPM